MTSGGGRNWRLVRANTDAVPSSVRRFTARARQRRLRAALPWAVAGGVVVVVGALVWMVFGTSVLGVREVRVAGTGLLTPLQVRQAAAVEMNRPLARVDLDAVRARVQALAAVDHAEVSRSWPAAIVVKVVERTPVAAVPAGRSWTLIDAEGVADRTATERPAGLPVAQLATPGPADANTRAALTVLAALSGELREKLVSISVEAPARIRLVLRGDRTVVWGDDTASERKAEVATHLLEQDGKVLDVSAADVVTIR